MTHPQIQFMEKVMSDAIDHIPEIDYLEAAKRNILSSIHIDLLQIKCKVKSRKNNTAPYLAIIPRHRFLDLP